MERSSGVNVRAVGYLLIPNHDIDRFSLQLSTRELAKTPAFEMSQRARKKVEALFAELKNQVGMRRLRLRRMKFVREQFFLAAAAQNIKRLVRFLGKAPNPALAATAQIFPGVPGFFCYVHGGRLEGQQAA